MQPSVFRSTTGITRTGKGEFGWLRGRKIYSFRKVPRKRKQTVDNLVQQRQKRRIRTWLSKNWKV
jgi:hypothetical protein